MLPLSFHWPAFRTPMRICFCAALASRGEHEVFVWEVALHRDSHTAVFQAMGSVSFPRS